MPSGARPKKHGNRSTSKPMSSSDMKKSVSFNKKRSGSKQGKLPDKPLANGATNGLNTNGDTSSNHDSSDYSVTRTEWYTRSVHREPSTLKDILGISPCEGAAHSLASPSSQILSSKDNSSTSSYAPTVSSPASMDALARDFFPVTLGAAYDTLRSADEDLSKPPLTPSSLKGLSQPSTSHWRVKSSSSHSSRKSRPGSAQSSSSSNSKNSIDRMYLMTVEAPNIGSSTVLLSSPYQSELARLRMERLRIEEEHLLEVKRQEELERIRGPSPKWYELKSPRFHYESHKNTELIKSKDDWQALIDYRMELEKACKEYHEKCST